MDKTSYAKMMAPQFLKNAKDSAEIVNHTKNPEVYFSRYDFMIDNLNKLIPLQPYIKLSGDSPEKLLHDICTKKDLTDSDFIHRYYDSVKSEIGSLKNKTAKEKHANQFIETMRSFYSRISVLNQKECENLFCALIDSINGAQASAHVDEILHEDFKGGAKMKTCPKCGYGNPDDSKFCVRCGCCLNPDAYIPNQTPTPQYQQNQTPPQKSASLFGGIFKGKENEQLKQEVASLRQENQDLRQRLNALGFTEYTQTQAAVRKMQQEIAQNNEVINRLRQEITGLAEAREKEEKKLKTATNKLNKSRELYKSVEYSITNYPDFDVRGLSVADSVALDELSPSVILKLHHMDVKDLRKAFRENEKQIEHLLTMYASRYTTKANQTIYQLMVIALRAELQNILYCLKYEKLDDAIEKVKDVTRKYLAIAGQGNQNIVSTLTKFIGEIEYLFINAVKIEYNYYVKKEQARQEQLAIREQMRQETEERRALEQEKKKIDAEETKYKTEIERVKEQMATAAQEESEKLQARILELQAQLADVVVKKETITNLQNGKAGNVYIISNLGSFGENMFKIGMTRRLDPQERVDELGSASVPFKFDVHSFIFSEDAVALEKSLHDALNDKRVNKVNLRKEFFYTTVDELEQLVSKIDSTAEFNKTMLAEEYRQSLSTNETYNTDFSFEDEED